MKPALLLHSSWGGGGNYSPSLGFSPIGSNASSYSCGIAGFSAERKHGFTLAEVLITLAIIGVVAAMTIPTLIAKINTIVTENQAKVFNAKLIKGLNLTKTAGDLNDTYGSTYEFLTDGLGKNLKMAKICDSDHIRDCVPYDKIKYDKNNTEETINVKDIKTAAKLKLPAPYTDTAAFVLADGTPAIVSYNLKCIDDPDKADTEINSCLAGIYDLNGTRKPNKFGTKVENDKTVYTGDLVAFNGAKLGNCAGVIGDVCFASTAVTANDAMLNLIKAVDDSYTMPTYDDPDLGTNNDYWQLANDYCDKVQGGKKLPTASDLAKIARVLYNDNSISDANSYNRKDGLNWDANKTAVFSALGISSTASGFGLWSSAPYGDTYAYRRHFYSSGTDYTSHNRYDTYIRAVCVE